MARTKEQAAKAEAKAAAAALASANKAKEAAAAPSVDEPPPRKRRIEPPVPPDQRLRSVTSPSSAAAAPSSAAAAPSSTAAASSSAAAAAGPSRAATLVPSKTVTLVENLRNAMQAVPELEFFIVHVLKRLSKVEECLKVQFDKNEALTEIVARQGHRSSGGGAANTGSDQLQASLSSNASAIFARLQVRTFAKLLCAGVLHIFSFHRTTRRNGRVSRQKCSETTNTLACGMWC
jgi:hypothetical protein